MQFVNNVLVFNRRKSANNRGTSKAHCRTGTNFSKASDRCSELSQMFAGVHEQDYNNFI